MNYGLIADNLTQFEGTGLLFQLFLVSLIFLLIRLERGTKKIMLVGFSVFALLIYFCPLWIIYINRRSDAEILYRVLWLIPMGMIIAAAMTEAVFMLPKKVRACSFAVCIVIIILSGQYVYVNRQFHKAENPYHVPQVVVDICDEIVIPGREVRACFPGEMIQYVRQYTPFVCQAYGRDALLLGVEYDMYAHIAPLLEEEVLDAEALAHELINSDTHYLIVNEDRKFTENIEDYDFKLINNFEGYNLYYDINSGLRN